MPERVAYVNGWVGPESQARISIYDRGFLSGYGVFERTRTVHGELFRLDEHLARLYRSLRVTRLDSAMSRDELRAVTIDLVAQNGKLLGPNDDYSVGHYVTRGEEGSGRPTVVVFCQPIPFKAFARQYIDGAHVVTPSTRQMDTQMVDPKLKTTSRIHQLLAEQEAKLVHPQAYALVLDLAGNVCEAFPGHNFWIVDGGTIAGAGLDVYWTEPPVGEPAPSPELFKLDNVILTPHIGSATWESRREMSKLAAINLVAMIRGERPPNIYNPEIYTG